MLLVVMLSIIWGNSLANGTDSGAMSGRVMAWINAFLRVSESNEQILHLAIRKMAHFTEFACLGLLLGWLFGMMGEEKGHLFCMPLFCGMVAACVDETIQVFVPGRGPSPIDIWIDTCGAAAGIAVLLTGYYYIRKKHKRKKLEETT